MKAAIISPSNHFLPALLEDAAGCAALLEDAAGCTEAPTPLYIGVR